MLAVATGVAAVGLLAIVGVIAAAAAAIQAFNAWWNDPDPCKQLEAFIAIFGLLLALFGLVSLGLQFGGTTPPSTLQPAYAGALPSGGTGSTAVSSTAAVTNSAVNAGVLELGLTNPLIWMSTKDPKDQQPITVTEDMIRQKMQGAPFKTRQQAISLPKVQRIIQNLEAGQRPKAYSEYIQVDLEKNVIVDGNHRYVASRIFGIEWPTSGSLAMESGIIIGHAAAYRRLIHRGDEGRVPAGHAAAAVACHPRQRGWDRHSNPAPSPLTTQ